MVVRSSHPEPRSLRTRSAVPGSHQRSPPATRELASLGGGCLSDAAGWSCTRVRPCLSCFLNDQVTAALLGAGLLAVFRSQANVIVRARGGWGDGDRQGRGPWKGGTELGPHQLGPRWLWQALAGLPTPQGERKPGWLSGSLPGFKRCQVIRRREQR